MRSPPPIPDEPSLEINDRVHLTGHLQRKHTGRSSPLCLHVPRCGAPSPSPQRLEMKGNNGGPKRETTQSLISKSGSVKGPSLGLVSWSPCTLSWTSLKSGPNGSSNRPSEAQRAAPASVSPRAADSSRKLPQTKLFLSQGCCGGSQSGNAGCLLPLFPN